MRARLRQFAQNALLSVLSLVMCLGLLEVVVFRFILVPDDVLPNLSINGVVRYAPDTVATFRHPDGRSSRVTINAEGWNSTKAAYSETRSRGVKRIAVVGDSYVHGAFVDTEDGFPEIIEAELRQRGTATEVYRFGMDGAPLSQYLHMIRREVRNYKPDLVVVPLVHNDFDESWRFLKTRYSSSFLKIGRSVDGRPLEIPPADFHGGSADFLRHSAMFRYLYYETNAYLRFKGLISRYFWGGDETWNPEFISSAVDIRKIGDDEKNRFAARYVLSEMRRIAEQDGFNLLFVMDGVREAVYSGKRRSEYVVSRLNDLAAELTSELGLRFIDLQDVFASDFALAGERFEYPYDWHWNKRANRIVGEEIARLIDREMRLLEPKARSASR